MSKSSRAVRKFERMIGVFNARQENEYHIPLQSKQSYMTRLRQMKMSDADKMLEWKNYAETRQFSIVTKDEIKKEDHYKWLADNIHLFQTIDNDRGEPVGAIRIDNNDVSIWIDRSLWRSGIATFTLQHECNRGMTAKIVAGNIASMRCFIRAGFLPKEFIKSDIFENHYIFQKC